MAAAFPTLGRIGTVSSPASEASLLDQPREILKKGADKVEGLIEEGISTVMSCGSQWYINLGVVVGVSIIVLGMLKSVDKLFGSQCTTKLVNKLEDGKVKLFVETIFYFFSCSNRNLAIKIAIFAIF